MQLGDSRHVSDEMWQMVCDGAMSGAEAERIWAHAAGCPTCREQGLLWQELFGLVSELPVTPAPANVSGAVMTRIQRQHAWQWAGWLLAAAMVLPLLALATVSAGALWEALAGQPVVGGSVISGTLELMGLVLKSCVRMLLWLTHLPPLLSAGWLMLVLLANFVLIRLGDMFRRNVMEAFR